MTTRCRDYLRESHRLVALNLTRKARAELGLAASLAAEPNWLMRVL